MLLMPVSYRLARGNCKLYHNTKAINYLIMFVRTFMQFTVVDANWCRDFWFTFRRRYQA